MKSRKTRVISQVQAEKRLKEVLLKVQKAPGLKKLGSKAPWSVELQLMNRVTMAKLNLKYRGKDYATDVLSFPAMAPFRDLGILGELVICVPVLKTQARSLGLSAELELDVLLVHGVLHLLGLDHELGPKEAKKMARWESKILLTLLPKNHSHQLLGLIDRAYSGNEKE